MARSSKPEWMYLEQEFNGRVRVAALINSLLSVGAWGLTRNPVQLPIPVPTL